MMEITEEYWQQKRNIEKNHSWILHASYPVFRILTGTVILLIQNLSQQKRETP